MLIEARIIQKYTAEVYRYKMVKMYTERKGGGALFIPLIKGLLGLIFLYKLQFPMHWVFFFSFTDRTEYLHQKLF